ncbi:MAG: hypothetical protein WAK41_15630, partial [Roseiarcus sp.]|uniref:hypothetical protein n=1 Tax=Roseiarcus sp. TaxID=1969460 RepID=UPI003BAF84C1
LLQHLASPPKASGFCHRRRGVARRVGPHEVRSGANCGAGRFDMISQAIAFATLGEEAAPGSGRFDGAWRSRLSRSSTGRESQM